MYAALLTLKSFFTGYILSIIQLHDAREDWGVAWVWFRLVSRFVSRFVSCFCVLELLQPSRLNWS